MFCSNAGPHFLCYAFTPIGCASYAKRRLESPSMLRVSPFRKLGCLEYVAMLRVTPFRKLGCFLARGRQGQNSSRCRTKLHKEMCLFFQSWILGFQDPNFQTSNLLLKSLLQNSTLDPVWPRAGFWGSRTCFKTSNLLLNLFLQSSTLGPVQPRAGFLGSRTLISRQAIYY